MTQTFENRYFGSARHDVLRHIDSVPKNILEIGCGTGATIAVLRERGQVERAIGVELDAASAEIAAQVFDVVIKGTVESANIEDYVPENSLDAIFCLDVLEHTVDPWAIIKRVSPLLKKDGRLYISLPNIRNWKFIVRLAFKGDFIYRDAGLLDRTHLRFFVRDTAIELATCGGLEINKVVDAKHYKRFEIRNVLNFITRGLLRELIAKQWILVAERRH